MYHNDTHQVTVARGHLLSELRAWLVQIMPKGYKAHASHTNNIKFTYTQPVAVVTLPSKVRNWPWSINGVRYVHFKTCKWYSLGTQSTIFSVYGIEFMESVAKFLHLRHSKLYHIGLLQSLYLHFTLVCAVYINILSITQQNQWTCLKFNHHSTNNAMGKVGLPRGTLMEVGVLRCIILLVTWRTLAFVFPCPCASLRKYEQTSFLPCSLMSSCFLSSSSMAAFFMIVCLGLT